MDTLALQSRTLLIVTTLVAVVLGLIVWVARGNMAIFFRNRWFLTLVFVLLGGALGWTFPDDQPQLPRNSNRRSVWVSSWYA